MATHPDALARLNTRIAPYQGGYIPSGTEPGFIRPFPRIFIALAESFCAYLNDGGDEAHKEVFRFDMQVFGLCMAGGLDQHNWFEMHDAKNYINSLLGFEIDMSGPPEQLLPKHEKTKSLEKAGLVYVLRNASIPNLVKIGFTCQRLEVRVRQLSQSTSVPTDFQVVASFESKTPNHHEQVIHLLLNDKRATGSEFFSVSEADAVAACKQIIGGA